MQNFNHGDPMQFVCLECEARRPVPESFLAEHPNDYLSGLRLSGDDLREPHESGLCDRCRGFSLIARADLARRRSVIRQETEEAARQAQARTHLRLKAAEKAWEVLRVRPLEIRVIGREDEEGAGLEARFEHDGLIFSVVRQEHRYSPADFYPLRLPRACRECGVGAFPEVHNITSLGEILMQERPRCRACREKDQPAAAPARPITCTAAERALLDAFRQIAAEVATDLFPTE
jgi:hypothetical protein